jgi:hypothetical protein
MYPRNIGRALGISVRVAGRIAGQRIAAVGASPTIRAQPQTQSAGHIASQTSRGLRNGISGFLRPFRRVGGIVWLEVTGSFFLLFAAVFALRLWQSWSRMSGISRDFAIGAAVVFLYLGVTSFWRAHHR